MKEILKERKIRKRRVDAEICGVLQSNFVLLTSSEELDT